MEIAAWYAARHLAGTERFLRAFASARDVLSSFPGMGSERNDVLDGFRAYLVHPFVLFYRVDVTDESVRIVRVVHGKRDFTSEEFEE